MTNEHYFFIGIGGIGMSALAHLLLGQNKKVSGSDLQINASVMSLKEKGAIIFNTHATENIRAEMIVIYGSDIKSHNVEYTAALQKKCKILHRSDLLAHLSAQYKALAVAGTHGKTSTSGLLSAVLLKANKDPSFAIGGILCSTQTNFGIGKGGFFVLEADESDKTFLKYFPFGAIITNIDQDHLINYEGNFAKLIEAFKIFNNQIQSKEHLFWCADDCYLQQLNLQGNSYGFSETADWQILNLCQDGFNLTYDLYTQQKKYQNITLSLIGRHNALNSAAVFAMAIQLGVDEKDIRLSFAEFKGVKRRCEQKKIEQNILFIDDYAHHPAEIVTTLQGIRKAIGNRRLVALFQPHRYSRMQECQSELIHCFQDVDKLLITDIYAAGEEPIEGISAEKITAEIQNVHSDCCHSPREKLNEKLRECIEQNDVIVTLGAGDITKIFQGIEKNFLSKEFINSA